MKIAIQSLLTVIPALLVLSCDESDSPAVSAPRPEMTIVGVDSSSRMITISIANPTDKAVLVSSADGHSLHGAYWYSGDELVEAVECGTGFWEGSFSVGAFDTHKFQVPFPQAEQPSPSPSSSSLTLAIVYGGHGAVTRDELPTDSDEDPRRILVRHPDLLMGCRKLEAEVFLPNLDETGQGGSPSISGFAP